MGIKIFKKGDFAMLLSEGILKYEKYLVFRNLSKSTINGYKKELKYLLNYLETKNKTFAIHYKKILHKYFYL